MLGITRTQWILVAACSIGCGVSSLLLFGGVDSWTSSAAIGRVLVVTLSVALFSILARSIKNRRALAAAANPVSAQKAAMWQIVISIAAIGACGLSAYSKLRDMTTNEDIQNHQSFISSHADAILSMTPEIVPRCLPTTLDLPPPGRVILSDLWADIFVNYARYDGDVSKFRDRILYHVLRAERGLSKPDFEQFSKVVAPGEIKSKIRCLQDELVKSIQEYEHNPSNWMIKTSDF